MKIEIFPREHGFIARSRPEKDHDGDKGHGDGHRADILQQPDAEGNLPPKQEKSHQQRGGGAEEVGEDREKAQRRKPVLHAPFSLMPEAETIGEERTEKNQQIQRDHFKNLLSSFSDAAGSNSCRCSRSLSRDSSGERA